VSLIRAQATVISGSPDRVDASWEELSAALRADPSLEDGAIDGLLPLIAERTGGPVGRLFERLVEWLPASGRASRVASGLLGVRATDLRPDAIAAVACAVGSGVVASDVELATALARCLEGVPDPIPVGVAADARAILTPLARGAGENAEGSDLRTLLSAAFPLELRRSAARLLDGEGHLPLDRDRKRILGNEAATLLGRFLDFTRGGFLELVELTAAGPVAQALLRGVEVALATLGPERLGEALAKLTWPRVAAGLHAEVAVEVEVGGGLPLLAMPSAARLLCEALQARQGRRRHLLVATGGSADPGASLGTQSAWVTRFRLANLRHADLLALLLEVAPLTPERARVAVEMADAMVEDFGWLFAEVDREAKEVEKTWQRLRSAITSALSSAPEGAPLDGETTRRVRGFEDPATAGSASTLHGLKRLVHQRGLRDAFRRFGSMGSASKSLDLLLVDGERVGAPARAIRYVELEPGPASDEAGRPPAVELALRAYRANLLAGCVRLPDLELLCFGTEVQGYLRYRNHPAFLRLDLSPPLRGGLVDLEYFAVSQYELDRHPGLQLPAIRHVLERLDFDVDVDGVRLHARYDKERAFDLEQVLEHAELILRLAPWLMDLDWTVGGLEYPEEARDRLVRVWADRFAAWGVLPIDQVLTPDRRRVVARVEHDAAGIHEIPWEGIGDYRDVLSRGPPENVLERLRAAVSTIGLGEVPRWHLEAGPEAGQLAVERALLQPLEGALARGEAEEVGGSIRPAPPERFERVHAAVDLAHRLTGGDEARARAVRLANVVAPLEGHLRFLSVGEVNGHPVQRAEVQLPGERLELAVVRDGGSGTARLAVAHREGGGFRRVEEEGWRESPDLGPEELHARLLAAGYPCGELRGEGDASGWSELLRPSPRMVFRATSGERVVRGVCASPGRAAGVVRLAGQGRDVGDVEGSVLVAAAVGPEAAPALRRCRAVVSTGGGVLSHAGLIALELGKPALVVQGRWRQRGDHGPEVACRRLEYRESTEDVGGVRVTCRRDLAEREELLREGDLVVVDATAGALMVLGRDRDALAIDVELAALERVATALSHAQDPEAFLTLRGHLLRITHQLDKLVRNVRDPVLRRHLVWELLAGAGARPESRPQRQALLAVLLDPAVSEAAVEQARTRCLDRLGHARDAAAAALASALDARSSLLELVFVGVQLTRADQRLEDAAALAGGRSDSARTSGDSLRPRLEDRLEAIASELESELSRPAGPDDAWRLRHLAADVRRIEAFATSRRDRLSVLRREAEGRTREADRAAADKHRGRAVVHSRDGGLELRGLIGGKAANLGEIERILGAESVPAWFAVTDRAFRSALASPTGCGDGDLGSAIAAALAHCEGDPAAAASAVRRLWRSVALPESVVAEIADAYRGLAEKGGEPALVAVRSSTFEEDAESSAWAGQFDTFLFVRGEDDVMASLRLAWAGLWGERALRRRGAATTPGPGVGGGVVVQRMVAARVAGVIHTSAASLGDPGSLLLNVGLGLGEGVVSGQVDADLITVVKRGVTEGALTSLHYVVGDKRERVVFDSRRGRGTRREPTLYHQRFRPALEYVELAEVVARAMRLEAAYRQPLDIEFAFEGCEPLILQARPIPAFHHAWREATTVVDGEARRSATEEVTP